MSLSFGQKLANFVQDTLDAVTGQREALTPPRSLFLDSPYDPVAFKADGEKFLGYFKDLGKLQAGERILDVGCGAGQKAIPLTQYLDETGRYFGFDIHPGMIKWCQKQITSHYPHFQFRHDKLYHPVYNPKGKYKIIDHYFAYEPKDFHFVFMIDLLPYLLPDEALWYLSEMARVVKKRGRCFISLYLLNDESRRLLESGQSKFDFRTALDGHLTLNASEPRSGMAFDEEVIIKTLKNNELEIQDIHHGSWSGRETYLDEQDIIIAVKP